MSEHDDMISAVRDSVEQLSKPEAPETTAAPEKVEESASERARDEKGRFVASEPAEQPKEVQAAPEAVEAPVAESTPQLKPPTSWPPEAQKAFNSLQPEVQRAVLKREDEIAKGSQKYSEERQRLNTLESIIAPRREQFRRFNFKTDAEAINHLFSFSDALERDPAGTLAFFAKHYGVDLAQIAGGQPQQTSFQPQQQFAPDIEQKVSEAVNMEFAKMTVREFEANPPEHYQEVKPLMRMLLDNGQAQDLQDAYDKAVWMNPDIRTRLLEAQRAKEQQELSAKQAVKVTQKVKAANASLTGSPHGTPAPSAPKGMGQFGDVSDDVRAAVASLM